MNKKERLMAVLNHQLPDHMPVSFWHHFIGDEGEKSIQAHLDYYRETDIDFLKIMCDYLWYDLRYTITEAKDWFNVQPLPEDHPFFTETVKRCKAINEALKDECYTYFTFYSPAGIVRELGIIAPELLQNKTKCQVVTGHIRENPEAVRHAMCVVAGDYVRLAEKVIREGGCLGIYQSLQGAEKNWLTGEEYENVIRPADLLLLQGIEQYSPYNIVHMCSWAGTPNHLEYWKDYPGKVINWGTGVEQLSLAEGVRYFGKDRVLLGGFDNRPGYPLVSGTKEEIKGAVRKLLEEMKGIPFIIGADCTVPNTIDRDHIRWAVEASREINCL